MPVPVQGHRIVAIGDLNGALDVLREILRGTGVIDERDRWIGGRTHVIQTGDIFDRGGGQACECLRLLQDLGARARSTGGRVSQLLGNHEVMAALGDERWRTIDEYLAFADDDERAEWEVQLEQTRRQVAAKHPNLPDDVTNALVESWKRSSTPGREALEFALGPRGDIGMALRALPIAVIERGIVFCHGGLSPEWASLGMSGLAREAYHAWASPMEPDNIFQDENGPLWNRQLALGDPDRAAEQLRIVFDVLGVSRMVVGHTPTSHVHGGRARAIAMRHQGKLVCIDVGLPPDKPGIALLVDDVGGHEWCASGTRTLWTDD